jgi:hemerythrin-like domain-containing protein
MNTEARKPIKRSKELAPLSREHHEGLLLCWKIRTGLSKNIPVERIVAYTIYFCNTFLEPHFDEEEVYVFSLLPDDDAMKTEALAQHNHLRSMINSFGFSDNAVTSLSSFAAALEQHIRYEERELFNYIERAASTELLKIMGLELNKTDNSIIIKDEWPDKFWA